MQEQMHEQRKLLLTEGSDSTAECLWPQSGMVWPHMMTTSVCCERESGDSHEEQRVHAVQDAYNRMAGLGDNCACCIRRVRVLC